MAGQRTGSARDAGQTLPHSRADPILREQPFTRRLPDRMSGPRQNQNVKEPERDALARSRSDAARTF